MRRSSFSILLAFVLILGGCTAGKTVLPTETGGFPSPRAALSAIEQVSDTNTIYQITAKVSLTSPQGKLGFRLAVIMQPPDKLRIESIPILGPPDFFLAAKDGRFKAYLPGNQEFITGNASPNNLSRFLPVAWSAEQWVAVLLGHRPDASLYSGNLQGMMEGRLYRVDILDRKSVSESFWIDPENKRLEKLEIISPSGGKDTVLFSAFRDIEGSILPQNILIDTGDGKGSTIRIIYEASEIRKEVNNDLFVLSPPPEVIIRDLPN